MGLAGKITFTSGGNCYPLLASVSSWPISAPGVSNLSGRFVPEAEVNPGILNGSYRES